MQNFTLLDVINGKVILTDEQKNGLYSLISKGAHNKTKEIIYRRIFNDHFSMFPHYGILGRVKFTTLFNMPQPEFNGRSFWEYCAGQSYPDELRTVRGIFVQMR